MSLPNAPPVDDHSTQPHLSTAGLVNIVAVGGMVWAVLGQVVLQVQLLAIDDAAVQLPWLWTFRGVMMKTLQCEDEGVGDGVNAEALESPCRYDSKTTSDSETETGERIATCFLQQQWKGTLGFFVT